MPTLSPGVRLDRTRTLPRVLAHRGASGRAPENTIVLPDDGYASADHARVYFENGAWWVEDLMSSNGTSVNDQLISAPYKLAPGDCIKVGRTIFRIE